MTNVKTDINSMEVSGDGYVVRMTDQSLQVKIGENTPVGVNSKELWDGDFTFEPKVMSDVKWHNILVTSTCDHSDIRLKHIKIYTDEELQIGFAFKISDKTKDLDQERKLSLSEKVDMINSKLDVILENINDKNKPVEFRSFNITFSNDDDPLGFIRLLNKFKPINPM